MNQQNRNSYIDFVKGIAIISMIIGHCVEIGSGAEYYNQGLFWDSELHKIIYTFHMPLFALISGFLFFYSTEKHSLQNIIVNKARRLLIPVFIWGIFDFVFYKFLASLTGVMEFSPSSILYNWIYNLWFLKSIFLFSAIIAIIKNKFRDNAYLYLLIGCSMMLFPKVLDSNVHFFIYPYFVIGYFINKYRIHLSRSLYQKKKALTFIFLLVYVYMYTFYNKESYIYVSGLSLWGNSNVTHQLAINFYRWGIGFAGCFVILGICTFIHTSGLLSKLIVEIGKKSLALYILSIEINKFVYIFTCQNKQINYLFTILESIIVLIVSYILAYLFGKNKKISLILFGEKR